MGKEVSLLIVDDEINILHSLKRLFIDSYFDVFTTSSIQEALNALAKEKIKVVISDQRMPEMPGTEFLGKVKEQYPDTVRILLTGYADLDSIEKAINKGEIYRFINKPWDDEELKSAVRHAIDRYNLANENKELMAYIQGQNEKLTSLNEQLRKMYEAQKDFSSTVSHELRTPLASIKTALDIVLSGTAGKITEQQKDFLGKANASTDRLNLLINDILDLSKLEAGKAVLQVQNQDINALIGQVVNIHGLVAEKKGLYLKTQLDARVVPIPFDANRIRQVLENLINNAIKFTAQGGITVTTEHSPQNNFVKIDVRDSGVGMDEKDISQLFQKFRQLGNPATRETGGTGLGLAICKEIVAQHKGKIWAESKPGQGSTFSFVLPIQERRDG